MPGQPTKFRDMHPVAQGMTIALCIVLAAVVVGVVLLVFKLGAHAWLWAWRHA